MSIKFSVQMNEKYMYDFFLYNTYTKISGILGPVVGVIAFALSIYSWMQDGFNIAMPTMFIAVLFLVVNPMTLKSRAAMQVKHTPMFQKPLEYEISEEGICIRQEEAEALNKWEEIAKVASTKKCVIVYLNRVRAFVLPKECMGEQYEQIVEMMRAHVPAKKMRIK